METLATLSMSINVGDADAATASLERLKGAAKGAEAQFDRTGASFASSSAMSGTAAGQAEKSMRQLAEVYGVARDRLGRFTKEDGSFRLSQEATALVTLRNAQAQAALAKEQVQAANQVAALTKRYDALRAELDPLAAIETTLARRTELLSDAMARGVITADQHAAMLSKVTRAALAGVQGVDKYTGGLRNGGQHLTQFSFQLNDIATGLASGQKPMQVLAQQSGQIIQIFQQAAVEAGGFKAAIKGLTAEIVPMLVTFGPWIAGLSAVGAAVFYVVDQHNKQAKAIDDATKRLEEQRRALGQISPLLSQAKADADLAAEGQKNFDEWIRKANTSLAEQIRLRRIATLNETNDALLKAGEELRKNQAIFDKINKPGPAAFSTNVGGASMISAAAASVNKDSEAYKKAAANLKGAQEDVDRLLQRLAKQGQAPDEWFGKPAEGATHAAGAIRDVTKATEEYTRHAAPIQEDQLLKATKEIWPEAAAAAEAYANQQKALKDASDDSIRTFDQATAGQIRFSSKLEIATIDMENAARVARELRFDVEDIGRAIDNHDWASAFSSLLRVLEQVKAAFAEGATSAQKFAAISGLGQGIGSLIGGKTGAAISGAASGAQAGFQLGGPWGAAAGAALGGLTSVLGSSAAKAEKKIAELTKAVDTLRAENKTGSGSIAAALAEANANWNSDLEYSSAMLTSLRSIDAKTGAVASLIARQIGSGGLLNTKGLGLGSTSSQGSLGAGLLTGAGAFGAIAGGTGLLMGGFAGALALGPMGLVAGAVGALVGALMKTKTTTEVLDQGLTFAASTFGDIAKNGVSGSQYADLLTTTKKSLLGVGLSTKVKTSTVTSGIDPGLLGQISETIGLIGEGVLSAAAVFGVEAAKAAESALGSAVVDLGKLSLKDLKPTEIAEVLQATFDKVGDQLAAAGVPGLDDLANVGEGAFETLTRLAREYEVVDVALNSIGKAFGAVGLASIAARDDLIKAFGGADAFTSATSFFGQNFLTDAERLAPVIKAVNDNLKDYGLSAESSRDQFKSLVLAQDLTTEAGRNTYAMLMGLAPAFDKVASATEAQAKAVLDKRTSIQDQIDQLTLSSADLLSKTRAKERAEAVALNPALGDLIDQLYGLQDAAAATAGAVEAARQQQQIDTYLRSKSDEAMQAATAAQEAYTSQLSGIADAATSAAHALDDTIKSLTAFADSLKAELGMGTTGGGLEQARRAFNTAVSTGNYDAIPELGKAYADAAKEGAGSQSEYLRIIAQIRQASLNSTTSAKSDAYQSSLSAALMGAFFKGDQSLVQSILGQKGAGLPGFANGGSFTFGGNPGVDQNVLSLNNQPIANVSYGETAFIGRSGASNDNSATAALRAEIAGLRADLNAALAKIADNTKTAARILTSVTPNGDSLQTESAA